MTISMLRTMTCLVVTAVLAVGMVAGAEPATAYCTSTTIYVELDGDRINSPTNGCVGPTDWVRLLCTSREISNPDDSIVIGGGACVTIPPN